MGLIYPTDFIRKKVKILSLLADFLVAGALLSLLFPHHAYAQGFDRRKDIEMQLKDPKNIMPEKAVLLIYTDSSWSGSILDTSVSSATKEGFGDTRIEFDCSNSGIYSMAFQKMNTGGYLLLAIIQNGKLLNAKSTTAEYRLVSIAGQCD